MRLFCLCYFVSLENPEDNGVISRHVIENIISGLSLDMRRL